MASGRPLSPSQHTMKASARPRLRSSVRTIIQNLAPSPPAGPTHRPNTSRSPSKVTPMTTPADHLPTRRDRAPRLTPSPALPDHRVLSFGDHGVVAPGRNSARQGFGRVDRDEGGLKGGAEVG